MSTTDSASRLPALLFVSPAGHRAACAALMARSASKNVEALASYLDANLYETDYTLARVMTEDGLQLDDIVPLYLKQDLVDYATHVITLGCADADLGDLSGKEVIHWDLISPDGQDVRSIREIFEDLRWKVKELLDTL